MDGIQIVIKHVLVVLGFDLHVVCIPFLEFADVVDLVQICLDVRIFCRWCCDYGTYSCSCTIRIISACCSDVLKGFQSLF